MTFGEARTIIRKHYDMWAAAAKLHEVLEAAEKGESLLTVLNEEKVNREKRLVNLEKEYAAKKADYTTAMSKMDFDMAQVRKELLDAQEQAQLEAVASGTSHKERVAVLSKEYEDAKVKYATEMKQLASETVIVKARLQKLQAEFAATKEQISNLLK